MAKWAAGLTIAAGLAGAAGVAAAAGAAHGLGGRDLSIAADFLLFHASAIAAISLSARAQKACLAAATILAAGVALFCGDLAARGLGGGRLFPFAAPAGGLLLILGWLSLSAAGIGAFLRRDE